MNFYSNITTKSEVNFMNKIRVAVFGAYLQGYRKRICIFPTKQGHSTS